MKANPGGQLDIEDVIGRDPLIEVIWDTLELQSVVLVAERRIGKTTVMQVMEERPRKGWRVVRRDVEKCHSAMDFSKQVYSDVDHFLSAKNKTMRRCSEFFNRAAGTKLGVIELPKGKENAWKELLEKSIEDLVSACVEDERLVFMWDEIPYMIDNIRKSEGAETAMAIFDILRALRQDHGKILRMIFTGSIGLHHIFALLKKDGYGNSSTTNDMYQIRVDVLAEPDALNVAESLLKGENLAGEDYREIAKVIVQNSDCFGHYIHCIVKALKMLARQISKEDVELVLVEKLIDGGDEWDLDHYHERLQDYYGDDESLCIAILDTLAESVDPLSLDEIASGVSTRGKFGSRNALKEKLRGTLKLLRSDHYLKRCKDRKHAFLFPLIQRWWVLHRDL